MSTIKNLEQGLQSSRETILACLRTAQDWCSGEAMAVLLGMSRAGVGKQVAALRLLGHDIEASPRRGYRLAYEAVSFDARAVAQGLATREWGQGPERLVWLRQTLSTSSEAARRAVGGAPVGTVVVALRQEAGYGRKGHQWFTAPHSLAFSVILPSECSAGAKWDFDDLTLKAARVVAQVVAATTGEKTEAVPPNDVLLHGRKVAGVLLETGFRGSELDWMVLGVGVNVNARQEDFPPAIACRAASLRMQTGAPVCLTLLLQRLLKALEDSLHPALGNLPPW